MTHDASSQYEVISGQYFAPIHRKSSPKGKLGQVGISSNIAQNHRSSPGEVISGNYLPQFTLGVDQKQN